MALTAAIIVPTRGRTEYLRVALASIVPQAAARGAEVLVVLDGPDEPSRTVALAGGARVLQHEAPRGLNAARNTGIDATGADLLVFVDDDVEVRPGWLDALVGAAEELGEEYGVFTGPIHARFEDHPLRLCGREGPPVTALDLGRADTDADHAWGANMTLRRSALARAGRFDEARELYGDEQEWQARLRAAGGRMRYVAAAALDHRRAGDDARLPALARAAHRRGQASRRFDVFKGTAPSLGTELRTLAGCLAHGPRFRCANGPVMAAHSLGRLRAALGPAGRRSPSAGAAPGRPGYDDFLSGASGTVGGRRGRLRRAGDAAMDAREALSGRRRRLSRAAAAHPPRRRVLVVGIDRPGVPGLMAQARAELVRSRHHVEVHTAIAGERGKFENLNALLGAHPPQGYDWLVVIDDDVALPAGFLDRFLHAAESVGLRLAQPAHRLHSHAAWDVTRRRPGVTVRETSFVEIGPVTAFHRDTFATLLPFPELRMGWGLDAHWAAVARDHGWPIGVVDATPVGHTLRPAADAYPREAAAAEARAFLAGRPYVRRDEVRTLAVHR
ncbi:MAG: glycosyltransferase [Solirubrobacterales bacterium]|jgi:GT2 family glycosyltransferase|nr:glycosyltransferase [Solirubrobacterales bacterium]